MAMKAKILIPIIALVMLAALSIWGCKVTTTVAVEEVYDVRIVNRSGHDAKVRWGGDSYRHVDDGEVIIISTRDGCYALEWEDNPSRGHTATRKIFEIEVSADIDIVFNDDPDVNYIIIDR
jgi:hypothetical protein